LTKLIFIVAVTLLLVLWFKSMGRKKDQGGSKPDSKSGRAEDMVRCQVCGVNLPRSEALMSRGRFYCSDQHRLKDQSE
jgi:uncharacterized protein